LLSRVVAGLSGEADQAQKALTDVVLQLAARELIGNLPDKRSP